MMAIPVGLQLYSIRHECQKDLPGVLKRVALMGYNGVEFAGYYEYKAADLRKMMDDVGLVCCGTHTGMSTVADDKLTQTIDFNLTLGNRFLIVPGLPPEMTKSRAAWLETAKRFSDLSAKVKERGYWIGYHNHIHEFQPLDGELPWDTFFGHTPREVIMQLDTGNALRGDAESAPLLARYPGRALSVHLKDYSRATKLDTILGEGDVPWNTVLPLCEKLGGTKWYVIEHENPNVDAMDAAEKCLRGLQAVRQNLLKK
jgi:sugar phosphate isomerase/epimerase